MNKKVKKKWVKALRSGKYKQTRETLKDKHGYCCLGVLCDLAVQAGIATWEVKDNNKIFQIKTMEYSSIAVEGVKIPYLTASFVPKAVIEWAGLEEDNINFQNTDSADIIIKNNSLSSMNDDFEYSFKKIAKKIDKNL